MATKIRLRPTFDRILVKRETPEEVSKGGIVIPDAAVSKPNQGKIVDLGPNVMTKARLATFSGMVGVDPEAIQTFDIGEKVQIAQFAGIEMGIDKDTYVLIKQDEILDKIEEVEVPDTIQVETIEQ